MAPKGGSEFQPDLVAARLVREVAKVRPVNKKHGRKAALRPAIKDALREQSAVLSTTWNPNKR